MVLNNFHFKFLSLFSIYLVSFTLALSIDESGISIEGFTSVIQSNNFNGESGTFDFDPSNHNYTVLGSYPINRDDNQILLMSNNITDLDFFADKMVNDNYIDGVEFSSWNLNDIPSLEYLQLFDAILLQTNGVVEGNACVVGNVLYDYVMAGGNLILSSFYWQDRSDGGWGSSWCNLEEIDPIYGGSCKYELDILGSTADHPITDGIDELNAYFRGGPTHIKSDATAIAWWSDGNILAAYNQPAGMIIAITIFPAHEIYNSNFGGDIYELWANTINFVAACDDVDADGICDDVDDCIGEYDECNVCSGGNSGHDADSDIDCNGDCFGLAELDSCDVCSGGNSGHDADSDIDCYGDCFGLAELDSCDVCSGGNSDHVADSDNLGCGCFIDAALTYWFDTDNDGLGFGDPVDFCLEDLPDGWVDNSDDNWPDCSENDEDGDGNCGVDDICPGFDDNLDFDGDLYPDGCDATPFGDVILTWGNVTDTNIQIISNSNVDIYGFQFNISGISMIDIENEFFDAISFSDNSGNVIGFSFSGSYIPSGESVLANISFEPSSEVNTIVLSDAILSGQDGYSLGVISPENIEIPVCNSDDCGICYGDNSSCTGCTHSLADNYDEDNIFEDGSCIFIGGGPIDEEGGLVQTTEGDANVLLPPGALDEEVFIEIEIYNNFLRDFELNGPAYAIQPFSVELNLPATISLPYIIESDNLFFIKLDNENDTEWEIIVGGNYSDGMGSIEVSSFGIYAIGIYLDCNGVPNGDAFIDDCGVCSGGNTDLEPNADMDICGECFGDNISCSGCADPISLSYDEFALADCIDQELNEVENDYGDISCCLYDYEIILLDGYNLVSFNTIPDNNSIENIMLDLGENAVSILSEGIASTQVNPGQWIGSLTNIDYDKGYWLNVIIPDTLNLIGYKISQNIQYELHSGANLISFPFLGSFDITLTIPDNIEWNLDENYAILHTILGEAVGSIQIEPFNWVGSVNYLQGSEGYWFIVEEDVIFSFENYILLNSNNNIIISK